MALAADDRDEAFEMEEDEEEEFDHSEYNFIDQERIERAESEVNSEAPTDSSRVSAGESRPHAVDFPGFYKTIMWMERCTDPTPIKPTDAYFSASPS
jgi:hypothetical protein